MSDWLKGLRSTPATPRNRAINNRYGSRGPGELDEESPGSADGPSSAAAAGAAAGGAGGSGAAAGVRKTPRIAGAYERPWKETVSWYMHFPPADSTTSHRSGRRGLLLMVLLRGVGLGCGASCSKHRQRAKARQQHKHTRSLTCVNIC